MVERPVAHTVDSLALEELSLDLKETLVQIAALAHFVDQPEVLLVLD
jgi:hypothetical protein